MSSWKDAIDSSSNGLGCYDVREIDRHGYLDVQSDSEGFRIDGHVDGKIEVRGIPENGVDRVIEELNVNPRTGWFSS